MTTLFITGTNRGIGLELANQALAKGWEVFGSARGALSDYLTGHAKFHALQFDVTDHEAVRRAVAGINTPIDILINNAGVIGPVGNAATLEDFEGFMQTFSVNTIAPLVLTQALLPQLKRSKCPRVLTISSQMGSLSYAKSDRIAYRASKAALNKVMQGLATDLKPHGIAAISMHPGWVQTDMGGENADISPQESAAGILKVAETLDLSQTGRFIRWDGSSASW